MKTYIYKVLASICAIVVIVSCESNWTNPEATFDKGGLVKAVVDPTKTSIDFFGDLTTTTVEFDLVPTDANGKGSGELIQSANLLLEYFSATTQTTTTETSIAVITDLNSRIVYTVPELVALVGIDMSDLFGGDSFTFSFDITMKDGRILTHDEIENTICGPVNSRGTCTLTIPVVCPTDIPLGTWTNVTAGGDCLTYKSGGGDVELTLVGGILYELSDVDFGFYGVTTRGRFTDICGTITMGGATEFGINWSGPGIYTPNGGVNGKGRLEFPCHFDATFNPGYPEDLVFDKK